jgi:hypothetical protein
LERLKMSLAYAHLWDFKESEFPFSAPDGRRNFPGSLKCRQWLHLYKSYVATYTPKCLLFEKISKNRFTTNTNWFFAIFSRKIQISRKVKV